MRFQLTSKADSHDANKCNLAKNFSNFIFYKLRMMKLQLQLKFNQYTFQLLNCKYLISIRQHVICFKLI